MFSKRKESSLSRVHALHKTLNLVISCCCLAENGKKKVPKCNTHVKGIVSG